MLRTLTGYVLMLTALAVCSTHAYAAKWPEGTRINQLQAIGSHNSYKKAVQPELFVAMRALSREAEGIDYSHLSMTDQLNLGLRNLEIDVYHDPIGGMYASPLGNKLLRQQALNVWPIENEEDLQVPGFKVLHDADFDFRTWHITLEGALAELREWSGSNPDHEPILLTMNCKQQRTEVPGSVKPAPFDAAALKLLDETMIKGLTRSHILTPDDVRGDFDSVQDAIIKRGWPTIANAKGKYMLLLDEGGQTRQTYVESFPKLRSAAFFVSTSRESSEAAIFVMNEPVQQENEIIELVRAGYLVRTRADAATKEARTNDFSRFEAAKRSGAQFISTDYYVPDRKLSDRFVIRFDNGHLVRPNPVTSDKSP